MTSFSKLILRVALVIWILPLGLTGCKASSNESSRAANQPAVVSADTSNPSQTADDAPPPEKTGGFDGGGASSAVCDGLEVSALTTAGWFAARDDSLLLALQPVRPRGRIQMTRATRRISFENEVI